MMGVPPPRPTVGLGKSSVFPEDQLFLGGGRILGVGFDHVWSSVPPKSGGVELMLMGVLWVPIVVAVDVEEAEDIDEDELERGSSCFLRSAALTSSLLGVGPHGGRDIWEKVGGFATAVMEKKLWVA
jgi:hypothetical protein